MNDIEKMRSDLERLQQRVGTRKAKGITGDDRVIARMIGRKVELERAIGVIEQLHAEVERLRAALSREESQHMNTVDQRDMTEQFADRLASGIAEALGIEIGEHSSANNPWVEAITAIEEFDLAQHDAEVVEREANAFAGRFYDVPGGNVSPDEVYKWLLSRAAQLREQAKEVQS